MRSFCVTPSQILGRGVGLSENHSCVAGGCLSANNPGRGLSANNPGGLVTSGRMGLSTSRAPLQPGFLQSAKKGKHNAQADFQCAGFHVTRALATELFAVSRKGNAVPKGGRIFRLQKGCGFLSRFCFFRLPCHQRLSKRLRFEGFGAPKDSPFRNGSAFTARAKTDGSILG